MWLNAPRLVTNDELGINMLKYLLKLKGANKKISKILKLPSLDFVYICKNCCLANSKQNSCPRFINT